MTTAERDDPVVDRLLRAAAVAGGRFRLVVMARVLGIDSRDCLAAVDRAARAGVLVTAPEAGEGWFADDATRFHLGTASGRRTAPPDVLNRSATTTEGHTREPR